MDIDLMKSSSQDQMEMMTMMMQLDRLPELSGSGGPYSNTSESTEIDFCRGSATTAPIFHNPSGTSTTFPFLCSTPVQEPVTSPLAPNFVSPSSLQKRNSMEAMREMIFRMAVMQPIHIDPASVKPLKRRNVKISKDPQSVAARRRRERISEKIRILQRIVPGGTKLDTAAMLDEAVHYVKFLKKQVQSLEQAGVTNRPMGAVGFPTAEMLANVNHSSFVKACLPSQMVGSTQMLR